MTNDVLQWADDIEQAFWGMPNFLSLCSKNGIIPNRSRFSFAEDEVDFAGFRITMDSVRPTSRIIQNIKEFKAPTNITELRSFHGLVISQSVQPCLHCVEGDAAHLALVQAIHTIPVHRGGASSI